MVGVIPGFCGGVSVDHFFLLLAVLCVLFSVACLHNIDSVSGL
jgi:hypothetical protein